MIHKIEEEEEEATIQAKNSGKRNTILGKSKSKANAKIGSKNNTKAILEKDTSKQVKDVFERKREIHEAYQVVLNEYHKRANIRAKSIEKFQTCFKHGSNDTKGNQDRFPPKINTENGRLQYSININCCSI